MHAVVVYESMYGNTHLVADAVGAGLSTALDVSCVPVSHADPSVLAGADLVVVGGPTHAHGMSRATTRKAAVAAATKAVSPLELEPDALRPGAEGMVRLAWQVPGQGGRLRHPGARACRADQARHPRGWPVCCARTASM